MTEIANKKVLITGAAMGMGREMAYRFAEKNARLILVDMNEEKLEELADELKNKNVNVHTEVADLSKRENIYELKESVSNAVGRIDILVNNAGVVGGGALEEIDVDRDELTLAVNINAVHWMTKVFLPDLKAGDDCHVVNMASAAGLMGVAEQVLYSASKWFVVGHSEALREELLHQSQDHVNITIVTPGLVDTGMFEGAKSPLLTPILEPEYVVDRIIEGVTENELYVSEPLMVKIVPIIRGLLPRPAVDFLLDKLGAREVMQTFEGRD